MLKLKLTFKKNSYTNDKKKQRKKLTISFTTKI